MAPVAAALGARVAGGFFTGSIARAMGPSYPPVSRATGQYMALPGFRTLYVSGAGKGSAMAVPAFIRLSDSGVPLDPGLRRVLEESFSVDLSGVRLHAGPRTAAFLRLHGA